ncbi:manganese efflux pump MntP family protein [Lentisphaerota bacterium WC36G]|nr:manganese efflux pump MntP family protein [Lentisphaerae bacterium WC36]
MGIISVLLLGFSLACDSFAVAICCGISCEKSQFKVSNFIKSGVVFGLFQGVMTLLGFFIGKSALRFILSFNHYIALIILSFLGIKMIYNSIKSDQYNDDENKKNNPFSYKNLIILGFATSLDALAVGFSLIGKFQGIYTEALIIGVISFILGIIGVITGKKVGHFFENKMELIGGIILIGIGIKIFIEH